MNVTFLEMLEAMDGIALLIGPDLVVRAIGLRNWNSFWDKNGGSAKSSVSAGDKIPQ